MAVSPASRAALLNALGIAGAGVAAIDEQRFAGRRDDECCGATFGINKVDVQALGRRSRGRQCAGLQAGSNMR